MSVTAAADLEREEEDSSAGLSATAQPKRRRHLGEASPIPKMRRWRIVPCGRRPAAQCAGNDTKGIGNERKPDCSISPK